MGSIGSQGDTGTCCSWRRSGICGFMLGEYHIEPGDGRFEANLRIMLFLYPPHQIGGMCSTSGQTFLSDLLSLQLMYGLENVYGYDC